MFKIVFLFLSLLSVGCCSNKVLLEQQLLICYQNSIAIKESLNKIEKEMDAEKQWRDAVVSGDVILQGMITK